MAELWAIAYSRGRLRLLDQRKLPSEMLYVEIKDSRDGWTAIKDMIVRGAPAIAIAAALSLAVEVTFIDKELNTEEAIAFLNERLDYLVTSRPTAVNLSDAAEKLKKAARAANSSGACGVFDAYIEAAEAMLEDDVSSNKAIGLHGSEFLLKHVKGVDKLKVLTHCNTGSLATAGYGTALGVIRSLHSSGHLHTAFCTETRPYNQGSRLTAFELVHENIPATLITDSTAAALKASGRVDAIVVGADRIAANGDTANKIGTYSLAVSAFFHGIPFCIAAPVTSIDLSISSGSDITIEERAPEELFHVRGAEGAQVVVGDPRIPVWNPAFDVTPASLICAIITDKGVITKEAGSSAFDIPGFLENPAKAFLENPAKGFHVLKEDRVAAYVRNVSPLADMLGGTSKDWKVQEVGDGNLNYVYIIIGPKGSFVLKQALPYVRCVGESWPMTIERAYFESEALKEHRRHSPEHVPEVYHFDHPMALTVMEYLEPPHIILRKGLIAGQRYPLLAEHIAAYMASTLFHTSLLAMSTTEHKAAVAKFCGNVELCRLTEQVIFTEPYMVAANNRWTSPQLDDDAKAIREDDALKLEIAGLKTKFCEKPQALIHGDLHTGSIMVTPISTKAIDPEFAFYGPMGFDIGAFIGNLILAYVSQDGHARNDDDRAAYKKWILETISQTWNLFTEKFLALWKEEAHGDAYPKSLYNSDELVRLAQHAYIRSLLEDSLGFAAAKMIRRIVGIAHVEDFESIKDADVRAKCERRALKLASELIKSRRQIACIESVIEMISLT